MKLPKTEVLARLEASLRLLGRDRNTVASYRRTAGNFYDFVREHQNSGEPRLSPERLAEEFLTRRVLAQDQAPLYRHPQLDRATSPMEPLAWALALEAAAS